MTPINKSPVVAIACVCLAFVGCSEQKNMLPEITLEDSVANVESLTEEILTAFETGDPKAADPPLHKISYAMTEVLKQAKAKISSEEILAKLKGHINTLLDGLEGELHDFMHGGAVPEDYDIAPLATKLRQAVEDLKSDLGITLDETAGAPMPEGSQSK